MQVLFNKYPITIFKSSILQETPLLGVLSDHEIYHDQDGKHYLDGRIDVWIYDVATKTRVAKLGSFMLDSKKTGISEIDEMIKQKLLEHINLEKEIKELTK